MSHTHEWQIWPSGRVHCKTCPESLVGGKLLRRLNTFDALLAAAKGITEWADATFGECEDGCDCANCRLRAAIAQAESEAGS